MGLFTRYLKNGLREYVKSSGNWIFVGLCAIASAVLFCCHGIRIQNILTGLLIGTAFALVFLLLYLIIGSAVSASKYAEFNAYGFTRERAQKFKQRLDAGKKFKTEDWIYYAETLMRTGDPEAALEVLSNLSINYNNEPRIQAAYYYLCIMSFLKVGNVPDAEKMSAVPELVELCKTDKRYMPFSTLVNLPLIMIDLYKGQTDSDRFEAGCKQLSEFEHSEVFAKYQTPDIHILCLCVLKKLGQDDDFKEYFPWLKSMLNNYQPPWDFMYNDYLAEFKKAANGVLPFLD